jgi:hypothetical protein
MLEGLYNLLSPLSPASYTPASFQPFSVALNNAQSVLGIDNQVVTQEEIDEATVNLQDAYAGLVNVPAENGSGVGAGTDAGTTPTTSASAGTTTGNPAIRNTAANNSQSLAGSTNLAAVPENTNAAADGTSDLATNGGSTAGTSDNASSVASPLASLADAVVPLASPEQAPLLNWLSISLGAIALALLIAVMVLLRKRQQSHER